MLAKRIKQINLIPQSDFDETSLGRILKWALSTFRVMVIFTELVVMSAFLSRFWLDAKNSDLNEEINIGKAQVLAYSDIETEFRLNQKRIGIAKSLYAQRAIDMVITDITKLIPPDISFNSINITGSELEIRATSSSERSIAQFLVNLDSYKGVKDVNLSQVASSVENEALTSFTVTGLLN